VAAVCDGARRCVVQVDSTAPRVVVNVEPVGVEMGLNYSPGGTKDFLLQGECDKQLLALARALGWEQDILKYAHDMCTDSRALLLSV
jgi:hypothetical protein